MNSIKRQWALLNGLRRVGIRFKRVWIGNGLFRVRLKWVEGLMSLADLDIGLYGLKKD